MLYLKKKKSMRIHLGSEELTWDKELRKTTCKDKTKQNKKQNKKTKKQQQQNKVKKVRDKTKTNNIK